MRPVVPGHADGGWLPDNGIAGNVMLRIGEVQNIYFPEDQENVSKRFVEYRVWVQHKANGTAVTKMYDHCIAIDHLAAIADYSYATFRADPAATKESSQKRAAAGKGARVLLLCINGESQNAVILGGIRDAAAPDDVKDTKDDGHHLHSVFNGIDFSINKDGELLLTYNGATDLDGNPAEGTDTDAAGTFIKIDKKGNLTVSDGNGDNLVFIDRVNGKIRVQTAAEVDIVSPKVRLGDDQTDDPAVKGNELKGLMSDLIDAIAQLTVPTAVGPSGIPINLAAFKAVQARLDEMLSDTVFLK
jgi:hypothetical protein